MSSIRGSGGIGLTEGVGDVDDVGLETLVEILLPICRCITKGFLCCVFGIGFIVTVHEVKIQETSTIIHLIVSPVVCPSTTIHLHQPCLTSSPLHEFVHSAQQIVVLVNQSTVAERRQLHVNA